jgi:hypothetical protein
VTVNLALWLVVLLAGFALEFIGLRREGDKWEPLTTYIRRFVPKVIVGAGIAWLAWHFLLQS